MLNLLEKLYPPARALLFRMDAERAHELTLNSLKSLSRFGSGKPAQNTSKSIELLGLKFPNLVGLAAGLDKNGDYIDTLAGLGFGFLEIGTVTPRPQPGNPKPRLFRLPRSQAVINRMGFNNKGVDYLVSCVAAACFQGVLGVNIGKNFDTPNERALDDYVICLRKAWTYASYIVVNISSPNTKDLRDLQTGNALTDLLDGLKNEQDALARQTGKSVPLLVKIAPDLNGAEIEDIGKVIVKKQIDGVICTNTTISRPEMKNQPFGNEAGGLSGAPLQPLATEVLRKMRACVGPKLSIIGVGGILSSEDAREKLAAGANLVQIYTGLIYRGPRLIGEIIRNG